MCWLDGHVCGLMAMVVDVKWLGGRVSSGLVAYCGRLGGRVSNGLMATGVA